MSFYISNSSHIFVLFSEFFFFISTGTSVPDLIITLNIEYRFESFCHFEQTIILHIIFRIKNNNRLVDIRSFLPIFPRLLSIIIFVVYSMNIEYRLLSHFAISNKQSHCHIIFQSTTHSQVSLHISSYVVDSFLQYTFQCVFRLSYTLQHYQNFIIYDGSTMFS